MLEQELESKKDEEIVELVFEKKEVFAVLIRRYEKKVLGYVKRINGLTQESAEDVAQNIFIKAYVNINSFNRKQKFSNWLFSIAHNESVDYWRKNKKHANLISLEASEELFSMLSSDDDLAGEFEKKWDSLEIQKIISKIPAKYREILMLRFLEDKSYEEIARILRKPVSTIGTMVRRAKKIFSDTLK